MAGSTALRASRTGKLDLSRTQARSYLPAWVTKRKEFSDISKYSHPARVCRQEPSERYQSEVEIVAEWLSKVGVLNFASAARLLAIGKNVRHKYLAPGENLLQPGGGGVLLEQFIVVFSGSMSAFDESTRPAEFIARIGPGLSVGKLDEMYCSVVDGLHQRRISDAAVGAAPSSNRTTPRLGDTDAVVSGTALPKCPEYLSSLRVTAGKRGADLLVVQRSEAREALAHLATKLVWEDCDFLQSVPLFSGWSRFELLVLLRRMGRQVMPQGAIVCRQGETPKAIYFLKRGRCEVQRSHVETVKFSRGSAGAGTRSVRRIATLGEVSPGSVFGEGAIFRGTRRFADVVCTTACEVLSLPSSQLLQLLHHGALEKLHDQAMGYGADKDVDQTFMRQVLAAKRVRSNIEGISKEQEERDRRLGRAASHLGGAGGAAGGRRGQQPVWQGPSPKRSHRISVEDAAWGPPMPSNATVESRLLAEAIARERQGPSAGHAAGGMGTSSTTAPLSDLKARATDGSDPAGAGLGSTPTSGSDSLYAAADSLLGGDSTGYEEEEEENISSVHMSGRVGKLLVDARSNPLKEQLRASGKGQRRLAVQRGHDSVNLTEEGVPILPVGRRGSLGGTSQTTHGSGGAASHGSSSNHRDSREEEIGSDGSSEGDFKGAKGGRRRSSSAGVGVIRVPSFALQRSGSRPMLTEGQSAEDPEEETPRDGVVVAGVEEVLSGTRAGRERLLNEASLAGSRRNSARGGGSDQYGSDQAGQVHVGLRRFQSFIKQEPAEPAGGMRPGDRSRLGGSPPRPGASAGTGKGRRAGGVAGQGSQRRSPVRRLSKDVRSPVAAPRAPPQRGTPPAVRAIAPGTRVRHAARAELAAKSTRRREAAVRRLVRASGGKNSTDTHGRRQHRRKSSTSYADAFSGTRAAGVAAGTGVRDGELGELGRKLLQERRESLRGGQQQAGDKFRVRSGSTSRRGSAAGDYPIDANSGGGVERGPIAESKYQTGARRLDPLVSPLRASQRRPTALADPKDSLEDRDAEFKATSGRHGGTAAYSYDSEKQAAVLRQLAAASGLRPAWMAAAPTGGFGAGPGPGLASSRGGAGAASHGALRRIGSRTAPGGVAGSGSESAHLLPGKVDARGCLDRGESVELVAAPKSRLFYGDLSAAWEAEAQSREQALARGKRATAKVSMLATPGEVAAKAAELIAKVEKHIERNSAMQRKSSKRELAKKSSKRELPRTSSKRGLARRASKQSVGAEQAQVSKATGLSDGGSGVHHNRAVISSPTGDRAVVSDDDDDEDEDEDEEVHELNSARWSKDLGNLGAEEVQTPRSGTDDDSFSESTLGPSVPGSPDVEADESERGVLPQFLTTLKRTSSKEFIDMNRQSAGVPSWQGQQSGSAVLNSIRA